MQPSIPLPMLFGLAKPYPLPAHIQSRARRKHDDDELDDVPAVAEPRKSAKSAQRIARLESIVEYLASHPSTAAETADALGIILNTVKKDLLVLRAEGRIEQATRQQPIAWRAA